MSGDEDNLPEESEEERRDYEVFSAAREFIRLQNGDVVSIDEVLEHLDERFGVAAALSSDVPTVLGLCVELWEDPHIDQVPGPWIWFSWNEEGYWPQQSPSLARRLGVSSEPLQ